MTPLVSIITVNYNSTAVTCDLLRSINKISYPYIEVIVVDNHSAEDPAHQFTAILPGAKMVRSDKNLGFAGGNNLGIMHARGTYFLFVNNDTELTPNIIEGLLEVFEKCPDAGVVSPKFHYYFHPDLIEYAGYQAVNIFNGRNNMIGCKEKDHGQYDELRQTHYAHGGAMMVPAKVVKEVGLMPEMYFLYYEEFDWCEQIKRHGYKIYYQYKSLIYHKESMTTGKKSVLKTFYITRNRILFMRRNMGWGSFAVFLVYLSLITIPKNTISFLLKKETGHLKAFWQGVMWNLNNLKTNNI